MEYVIANHLGINGIKIDSLKKLDQEHNTFETPFDKESWEKDFNSIYLEYILPKGKYIPTLEDAWEDTYICKVLINGQWRHCFLYDKKLMLRWIESVPWTENDYKENTWARESEGTMTKLVSKKQMFIVK